MPNFTLSPSKPAKYSDANGRYTRIEGGQIPFRGRSLGASRRGKYCLAVAAAAAASHANSASDDENMNAASVVAPSSTRRRKKALTLEEISATAGRRSMAMIMDDTSPSAPGVPDTSSGSDTSSSASIFVSHMQGIISLIGVILLLILVRFAKISVDNATYVRGLPSGSSKPPSAAVTVAAMGLTGNQAFNLIFGSDQFFQIVAFIEAICSAVASYMAGSSIVTSLTDMNRNGTPLLELDMSQAGTLWGICGLWMVALALHATTAFANKSTIQTVQMASQESMREIVAVMHTESVYSGKQ
ncbi:hypothetical protein NDA18_003275 [Ustilago nuda]|nr:hypothetical protein NDA18_003275 [Ustilago nuda]